MELQILDPFGDYETAGYLHNVYQEKNLRLIGHLETAAFEQEVLSTVRILRRLPTLQYRYITETHHRLFNSPYPWAGQDRSITAPDIAIAKGGYSNLFAHPADCQRAAEYALHHGQDAIYLRVVVTGLSSTGHHFRSIPLPNRRRRSLWIESDPLPQLGCAGRTPMIQSSRFFLNRTRALDFSPVSASCYPPAAGSRSLSSPGIYPPPAQEATSNDQVFQANTCCCVSPVSLCLDTHRRQRSSRAQHRPSTHF